jgi:NitT/TauT family transport system substrate-binding protein
MKRHSLPCFFLIMGLLMLFFQAANSEARNVPSPMTRLKVAILPYLSYAPFFIADEEGYFRDQGIELDLVRFAHSPDAIPSLAQGELDVAGGLLTINMLNAMARGAKIRFVADKSFTDPAGCTYSALVARRSLVQEGTLKDPSGLKGRRIAFNEASLEGFWVEKVLKTAGLGIKDVLAGDIPDPAMVSALEKGAVDLAVPAEPWVTRAVTSGHGVCWMPIEKVIPDFQFGIVLFGPTLLDKNPEAGALFMAAYLKGVGQYNQGKTARNLEILAKHTRLDRELLQQACWPPFRPGGRINVKSVLEFQAWAIEKGYLEKAVPETQFWTPIFIDRAERLTGSASR